MALAPESGSFEKVCPILHLFIECILLLNLVLALKEVKTSIFLHLAAPVLLVVVRICDFQRWDAIYEALQLSASVQMIVSLQNYGFFLLGALELLVFWQFIAKLLLQVPFNQHILLRWVIIANLGLGDRLFIFYYLLQTPNVY